MVRKGGFNVESQKLDWKAQPVSCRLLLGSIPKSEEVLWRYMMDEYGIAYRNILPGHVHEMLVLLGPTHWSAEAWVSWPWPRDNVKNGHPSNTGGTYYLNWIEDRSTKTQCICCVGCSYTTLNIDMFFMFLLFFLMFHPFFYDSHCFNHVLRSRWSLTNACPPPSKVRCILRTGEVLRRRTDLRGFW